MLLAMLECRPLRWATWGVLLLGIVLRVHDFAICRSLWLDEVMLARNIVERSPAELFQPLDHNQAAPIGFLLTQKLTVQLFGEREWALRLVPLLLGIWSLFLFSRLSARFVGPLVALLCLTLFAFAPTLIVASNKQYLVDVWASLMVMTLAFRTNYQGHRACDYAWLGVAGGALVWMSQPAALVLAAAGSTLLLQHLSRRDWLSSMWTTLAIACWLASFALNYFAFTRSLHGNAYLLAYWSAGFPPPSSGLLSDGRWLLGAALGFVRNPCHVKPADVATVLLIVGVATLAWRLRPQFGLLVLPILITLATTEARLFPFQGRLVMFLLPFYCWLVGVGLQRVLQARPPALRGAALAVLLLLMVRPLGDARKLLLHPPAWEEPRELIAHIAAGSQPGDVLYVHPNGVHALAYYRRFYRLDHLCIVHGVLSDAPASLTQLHELRAGRRVWALHLEIKDQACPIRPITKDQLIGALAQDRELLDNVAAPGATAMLFSPATAFLARKP